jgi:hypothetical protein
MRTLFTKFQQFDAKVHAGLLARYPRAMHYADMASALVVELLSSPLFAVIAGLLGLVLAITTAHTLVVVAITLAWLISCFWVARTKGIRSLTIFTRGLVLLTAAVGLAVMGYFFGQWALNQYYEEHPPEGASTLLINAAPALRTDKGLYYFPVYVTATGKGNVTQYGYIFGGRPQPTIVLQQDTDALMKDLEDHLSANVKLSAKGASQDQVVLAGEHPFMTGNPYSTLSPDLYNKVMSGDMFYYYGVVAFYTDITSPRTGKVYVAEGCFIYDPQLHQSVNCPGQHSFPKSTKFPR